MKIDYYKVLGVARDATSSDIKQAFRRLALEFHPDRHVRGSNQSQESAGRRFRQVSEAYEVLGDNVKRTAYNEGTNYAGAQASPTSRYEGPPRRRYYRRNNQGYTTYGSAQARSSYGKGSGQRWSYESEYTAAERRERLINTIFFGFALPLFIFADYIEAAFWPKLKTKPNPINMTAEPMRPEFQKQREECPKRKGKKLLGRVPMQAPDVDTRPIIAAAVSNMRDVPDQGCKSLLGKSKGSSSSSSVGYTYIVGQGFGKLESASNLAAKAAPHASGPQHLRSLLSMECRLSDLRFEGVHTWLRQRTPAPLHRESA